MIGGGGNIEIADDTVDWWRWFIVVPIGKLIEWQELSDDNDDDDGSNIEIADDTVDWWRRLAKTIDTTPSKAIYCCTNR